ncbi:hypothetical protein TCAL_16733 [Tigriopus californicus]|uniref:DDE Tnp4 domain-containing protein n=1 Tax=Tigriopus californicus TaxID=6832 RepID=A0A553PTS6_TIGCA|nr:hypothetical protein TCAL_16733 [Tigriopus californicus]
MTFHSWDLHRAAVAGLLAEGVEELEDMEDILDKTKKKRSCWVQPWMASNMGQNPPIIYHELHDGVQFLESFRMDQPTFENILNKVRPLVEKKTTQLREPIPAKTRLMVTLIYFASGPSFNVLSKFFRISAASVCHIIAEVCGAIWITMAHDAFSLRNRIMKPFSSKSLNPKEQIFNYRLSRARRTVESAFGIMSGKFRLLRRPMDQNYGKCVSCVKAITVLHNHLLRPNDVVTQGSLSLMAPLPVVDRRRVNASGSAEVRTNREEMAQYFFSGDGQISSRTYRKCYKTTHPTLAANLHVLIGED